MGSNSGGVFQWDPGNPTFMDQFMDEELCWLNLSDTVNNDEIKKMKYREVMTTIPKCIKSIKNIKRLNDGNCIIQISKKDREDVLKINKLNEIPILISEHKTMNSKKGTIYHQSIEEYNTNADLLEDLQKDNKNITAVEIQKFWKDGVLVNSRRAVITFDLTKFPINFKIKFFYGWLSVWVYYPNPMQCRRCWGFNHKHTDTRPCDSVQICGSCSKKYHLEKDTNGKPKGKCEVTIKKCINCGGNHDAWDRECPTYLKQTDTIKCMIDERIPYRAAKDKMTKKADNMTKLQTPTNHSPNTNNLNNQQYNELKTENNRQYNELKTEILNITKQIKILSNLVITSIQTMTTNTKTTDTRDYRVPRRALDSSGSATPVPRPYANPNSQDADFMDTSDQGEPLTQRGYVTGTSDEVKDSKGSLDQRDKNTGQVSVSVCASAKSIKLRGNPPAYKTYDYSETG